MFTGDRIVWSSDFLIRSPTSKIGKNPDIICHYLTLFVGKIFSDINVWTLITKVGKNTNISFRECVFHFQKMFWNVGVAYCPFLKIHLNNFRNKRILLGARATTTAGGGVSRPKGHPRALEEWGPSYLYIWQMNPKDVTEGILFLSFCSLFVFVENLHFTFRMTHIQYWNWYYITVITLNEFFPVLGGAHLV